MGLIADLGNGPVGIDTAIFIYFMEANPQYLPLIEPLFKQADESRRHLVTSMLNLLEVLVVQYRAGDVILTDRCEALLTRSRGVHIVEISREHMRAAAQLRAATRVKTPDALQLLAAKAAGCDFFLTNDRRLPDLPDPRVLQLVLRTGR